MMHPPPQSTYSKMLQFDTAISILLLPISISQHTHRVFYIAIEPHILTLSRRGRDLEPCQLPVSSCASHPMVYDIDMIYASGDGSLILVRRNISQPQRILIRLGYFYLCRFKGEGHFSDRNAGLSVYGIADAKYLQFSMVDYTGIGKRTSLATFTGDRVYSRASYSKSPDARDICFRFFPLLRALGLNTGRTGRLCRVYAISDHPFVLLLRYIRTCVAD
ncbi:hypothetical protein BDQ17DRAFT_634691 [Cyathus striatus]|nr:hypothetical protein BDQ17DRAFT_634691 [Cyathus striatus]